jgi:hypothetical protein
MKVCLLFEVNKLEALIRDYIIHSMKYTILSSTTVGMYLSAISHFYQLGDITLRWKKLKKICRLFHKTC